MNMASAPVRATPAHNAHCDRWSHAPGAGRIDFRGSPTSVPNQAGVALLVVLWVVALLAIIAGSYSIVLRTDTAIVRNAVLAAQARAVAHAGVHLAVLKLVNRTIPENSTADSISYEATFSSARLHIVVTDEAGKIDLNRAGPALLDNLLRAAGIASNQANALVGAIEDWRDQDDIRRLNGAEKDDYQAAGIRYLPRNGPFQSVDELALVLGMKFALFKQLQGALTVYRGSGGLNPAAAPALVRLALGGSGGADSATDDTRQSKTPPPGGGFRVGTPGQILSIQVQAELPEGIREHLTAVVRLSPNRIGTPFSVIAWKENDEGTFDQTQWPLHSKIQ